MKPNAFTIVVGWITPKFLFVMLRSEINKSSKPLLSGGIKH
ncbi:hypothetical protein HMPREF0650_1799 [Hoylesella buccalis ATCC 35310]|uniref:Uncharacterized protein n=1 Tax=Hoylesella buccalis ATCC 35310 TaxID=679190 RepID=D1W2I0_9BACT|nr:hypothetical protein HMPREF0650_1799 [Hoylesella buccalis ATCC 35310]